MQLIPSWLPGTFARSLAALGVSADRAQLTQLANELLEMWNSPGRVFHNSRHLISVLSSIEELGSCVHSPDILRIATWFHGVVFVPGSAVSLRLEGPAGENRSATFARKKLGELGLAQPVVDRICELISALHSHRNVDTDVDMRVLLDADLAILAADPQEYRDYLTALRQEFALASDAEFLRWRRRVIKQLLARPSIFLSPLATDWELPAHDNLLAELARLEKRLDAMPAETEDTDEDDATALEHLAVPLTPADTGIIKGMPSLVKNSEPETVTAQVPIIEAPQDELEPPSPATQRKVEGEDAADNTDLSSSLESAVDFFDDPKAPGK
ncbi:MAG: hypothetical protein Q4A71_03580 [Actinomycetaceae bacterium]|nr:hypothetical protein [Actinomycetaceae bacterium]